LTPRGQGGRVGPRGVGSGSGGSRRSNRATATNAVTCHAVIAAIGSGRTAQPLIIRKPRSANSRPISAANHMPDPLGVGATVKTSSAHHFDRHPIDGKAKYVTPHT